MEDKTNEEMKNPIDVIKEAVAELENSEEDAIEDENDTDLGFDVNVVFQDFGLSSESEEDSDEANIELPKEVEEVIERHVQQEIAKEMVAFEEAEREAMAGGANKDGPTCAAPKIPASNSTCLDLIWGAFEKDFVKITRKKDRKIYQIQKKFEEATEFVTAALNDSLDEETINIKCDEDGLFSNGGDLTEYRSCVKQQIRIAKQKGTMLLKEAKKRKKVKTSKQLLSFGKKETKLMSLRAALLPRCDICIDPSNNHEQDRRLGRVLCEFCNNTLPYTQGSMRF